MREGSLGFGFVAASMTLIATACSFVVGTGGLSGGGDPGGGGSNQQSSSGGGTDPSPPGSSGSGVDLGEAGPLPVASDDGGTIGPDSASAVVPPSGDSGPSPTKDSGARDAGGAADAGPPSACSVGKARVFLTSSLYDGDFGGVSGADSVCGARAAAQGLGGQWRAWLSDSATPASSHIYASAGPYVLLDGTVVAPNFAALVSGSLSHPISLTELAAPISDGQTEVWTDIDVTGQLGNGGFCTSSSGNDWSSADSGAPTPLVGHSNASDSTWSAAYLQFCDRTNVRLYCFEACK